MKLTKVNYSKWDKKAYFLVEGLKETFCIKLKSKTTIKQIKDELKSAVAAIPQQDTEEQTFNDLNIKGLEGTDI